MNSDVDTGRRRVMDGPGPDPYAFDPNFCVPFVFGEGPPCRSESACRHQWCAARSIATPAPAAAGIEEVDRG